MCLHCFSLDVNRLLTGTNSYMDKIHLYSFFCHVVLERYVSLQKTWEISSCGKEIVFRLKLTQEFFL